MYKFTHLLVLSSFAMSLNAAEEAAKKETSAKEVTKTEEVKTQDLGKSIDQDTVIIEATRTNGTAVDQPYSISFITREEMDKFQVRNLDDAIRRMPGVTSNGSVRSQAQKPVIRGLSGARVLTVIDGVRQNFDSTYRSNAYIDFDLVKQVEVIRGPASALWGSGALGGVLSLETVDPSDLLDDGNSFGLKLNSGFDSVNDGLRYGTTLFGARDNIEYLFSITRQESNDYELSNGENFDYSAMDNFSTLSKLIWHASEFDKLTFQYETYYADERKPLREIATDSTILDQEAKRDTFKFGYEHDDTNDVFDFEFNAYYTKLNLDDSGFIASWNETETSYETIGFDVKNQTVWKQSNKIKHKFTYGLEFFRDEQEGERDGSDYPSFRDAEQDNLGIFIQDEIEIGEKWVIIPGLRYDDYSSSSEAGDDVDADKINPKIGLIYHFNDEIDLFANYSHGMRGPSLREKYISGDFGSLFAPQFFANPDLEEETSENWDLGFRYNKDDAFQGGDNFSFSYTFFHSEYEDFIELETTQGPPFFPFGPFGPSFNETYQQYVNVGDATIHGHELELSYSTEDFLFWANYAYTHGQNDEEDVPLGNMPAQTINYGIDYRFLDDFTVGYAGQFVDTQDRLAPGEEELAGYNVHDVFVRWAPLDGSLYGLSVTLGVENILDEEYETALNDFETFSPGQNLKATIAYTIQF